MDDSLVTLTDACVDNKQTLSRKRSGFRQHFRNFCCDPFQWRTTGMLTLALSDEIILSIDRLLIMALQVRLIEEAFSRTEQTLWR